MIVHLLILGHVLHWLWTGRTITPIEPSEGKDLALKGEINAGLIFFAAAILGTMFLGRWVCGWGCHLIAYQDLTNWVLKKLHLRPKAFRSRFLIFIPLLAAVYMFFWPAIYRLLVGLPQPRVTVEVTRTGFWDTFPEYGIAILTILICGVVIIYFLGAKGFCTYACPYGAFFGLADKLAVGRIRVTSACNQCGHCTAVCTSNVDVAQEVKLHKMVVDPGCMKCLDCVSVCPNDALYFGFGRPSLGKSPASRRYDLGFGEELAALIIFAAAFFCFRGLYGKVPFLMALGMAGILTYLVMKGAGLLYRRDVLLQKVRLKVAGRMLPAGKAFIVGLLAAAGFTVSGGVWQYRNFAGSAPAWQLVASVQARLGRTDDARRSLIRAIAVQPASHYAVELLERLARQDQDFAAAAADYQAALAKHPNEAVLHYGRAHALARLGQYRESVGAYRQALALNSDATGVRAELGAAYLAMNDLPAAIREYETVVRTLPQDGEALYRLGFLYLQAGRIAEAKPHFEAVLRHGRPDEKKLAHEALIKIGYSGGS
jgi:polyferredoxin/Flp pilus assembly protein TadD